MNQHKVVSRAEWLEARIAHLQREKAWTRMRDELNAERLALPWVLIEKDYVFDGPGGPLHLRDLFGDRSQLFIKHFMMGPGEDNLCVGCSLEADHLEAMLPHLENHDVSCVVVARAPIAEIEAVRKRMGWPFLWVSSSRNDFNYDFHVSFTDEELAAGSAYYNYRLTHPGMKDLSGDSAFYRDEDGQIYHTYSSYGRGPEPILGIYGVLDMTPKGRNETGPFHSIPDWARPRDMYGKGGTVGMGGRYSAKNCCAEQ
jgi:predicted dithiol-disulfide oxidoreductase (DUF899 family)